MKYLLYYLDGFIKKFPLQGSEISIGRKKDNNLAIDLDSISREHVKIQIGSDLILRDLNSTNGTFVRNVRITEKKLEMGESFNIGGLEFFLREGNLDEFKTADELKPIFRAINSSTQSPGTEEEDTRYINDIFADILQYIAKTGFRKRSFNHFIHDLSDYLSQLQNFGSISLLSKDDNDHNIYFTIEKMDNLLDLVTDLVEKDKDIFTEFRSDTTFPGTKYRFYSFPVELGLIKAVMIYVPLTPGMAEGDIVLEFLDLLAKEISLLARILINGNELKGQDVSDDLEEGKVPIIAVDPELKNLIKQTVKIAKSNVFALIEGESGTGKELFAKLLHENSKRSSGSFIAINCAAIPETLLESELFGYEKGAFTGAFAKKKGKIEVASGGSLILDEIGDMPLQLQAKILRVLQENELYRLGGTTPIKVDLRIISLTNKNLKTLISEDKFREDLYYRLVHHRISIPPLRNRREDISPLINHFTEKFSRELDKNIGGYTVQVFRAMGNYSWPGNVRQLENEVRRLVNLVEPGENIHYELLSEELKRGNRVTDKADKPDQGIYGEFGTEKDYIIHLLDKNGWNKSRTASTLGITYQGLHKKMKRLGIEKKSK
ncbi:MAG: sigma 54-interacting transcriptional regulator [Acidobacteriota bacterium]